ncbi:helix-turn-helix transcriptional regulator [Sphingomonas tabacisoli]|uniref:Helix-turn-helix transcriptional regulator n=1 Tax=Sphingomonas tabacisoli TaxID=2249466 RepID=A0ABW4I1F4_9SPHN
MNTANHETRRFEFRGKNKTDYYDGDLIALSAQEVDMRIDKSLLGEFAIYKLVSKTPLAFRRSWTHIRKDKTNLTVFWFIRRGRMAITATGPRYAIHPGEAAITRSSQAFYMELWPDERGPLEAMHVAVPTHILYPALNEQTEMGRPLPATRGDLHLAERIFEVLFEEADEVDPETAEQLVGTLVRGLGRAVEAMYGGSTNRLTLAEKRIADIVQFISKNFSNLDLNAKMVADSCGISLRYLCHVLKRNDMSFSDLLWDKRMETSKSWLEDEKMARYTVSEIAYLAGFKSSAHFSRKFKSRYGLAPREYRDSVALRPSA